MISDDPRVIAQDESPAGSAVLIGARAAPQPIVARGCAGGEFVKQVTVIERHGSDERHWDSQGAGVCMVLRSCSFASAGRSSIARNSLRSDEHTSELQSLMRNSYA